MTAVDRGAEEFLDAPALLARWRAGRAALNEALAGRARREKIPWYGTAMSPVSMATARIMETWAHGLDIAETLGVQRAPRRPGCGTSPTLGTARMVGPFLAHGLAHPRARCDSS